MLSTSEVIVIFLMVEGPVLRERDDGGWPHIDAHLLGVIEHLDLDGLVMALFAAIERSVIVFMPMLIVRTADKGGVVGKRNYRPVLS